MAFLGRWNYRKKHHIMESRRRANKLIANAMSALDAPPKVFITASAVGYYGARSGSKLLTEDMPAGEGFTAEVWCMLGPALVLLLMTMPSPGV